MVGLPTPHPRGSHRCRRRPCGRALCEDCATFQTLESRLCLSVPSGSEFLINTATADVQETMGPAAVASGGTGEFVAVWESFNQDTLLTWSVHAQAYGSSGVQSGAELGVGAGLPLDDYRRPSIARGASGEFVVVWDGAGLAGLLPSIYAQRFDAVGTPQGPVITVATGTIAQPRTQASVAFGPDGGFVIAWESTSQDTLLTSGVYARAYRADGTPRTAELAVNQTTAGDQSQPVVAITSSGDFIVAWSGRGTGDASGIFLRVFDADGTALSPERLVNSTSTAGVQSAPAIAIAMSGAFVIAWSGSGSGDPAGIFAQRFASSFAAVGGVLAINDDTAGTQATPSVAFDLDGDFTVAWSGSGAGDADGIYAREFRPDGTARRPGFRVNTTTAGVQAAPSIASRGDNAYVIVWSGAGAGDINGVFGRFLVDEPPVLTTTATLSYIENGGAAAVDSGLTVEDLDNTMLAGAWITISSNYVPGQDVLAFTNQFGIIGSWNGTTGTLTLTGMASLASYQAALRSITYTNISDNPSTASRSVGFVVSDGTSSNLAAIQTITVTAINDPPVITTTGTPLDYVENAGNVAIDSALSVFDVDSTTLAGATVSVSANYVPGEDVLAFTNQFGISGSWNSATGVLTLTGVASVGSYLAALRSVTYFNASETPATTTRSLTFTVSDGIDPSATTTRDIAVTAANDPPVLITTGALLPYTENDNPTPIDPGLSVTDVDSTTLTGATVTIGGNYAAGQDVLFFANQLGIVGSWNPATGTLTLTGTASTTDYQTALRSITYANTSDNPSTANRSVSFVVNDGADPSVSATHGIAVTGVNDLPVVITTGSALLYVENIAPISVDGSLILTDPDNVTLSGASINISGNYAAGQDVLTFTSQSGIVGSWSAATGTLTLTGIASLASYQTALRSITYANTSENPSTASRTLSFVVNDGTDSSSAAIRTIAVMATNDRPSIATAGSAMIYAENSGAIAVDSGLTVSDLDSILLTGATVAINGNYTLGQDALAFASQAGITSSWNAATGVLTLSGTATVASYQAALRSITYANLSDNPSTLVRTVSFVVTDGLDASLAAIRAVMVVSSNDAPSILTTTTILTYTENVGAITVDAGLTVADVDSTTLFGATIAITGNYVNGQDILAFANQSGIMGSWNPAMGTLTLTGTASIASYLAALRSITYANTSDNPSTLIRSVSFRVSDSTATSGAATRAIAVLAVNDAPVVAATNAALIYTENAGPIAIDPGLSLSDADSTALSGATIVIGGNYAAGQDVLAFTDQFGIHGSWDPAAGRLTLTGSASLAHYQIALRSVTYINMSDNPSSESRIVSITVADTLEDSTPASRAVAVIAVNDGPQIATTPTPIVYVENAAAVPLDPDLSLSDVDSANLFGATVTLASGYAPAEDALTFTSQSGILAVWDGLTGVLTLSGVTSVAAYQSALRAIVYANSSDRPSIDPRIILITVYDGFESSQAVISVLVEAVDDAPAVRASSSALAYVEGDGAIAVDADLLVEDVDSEMLAGATISISGNYDADSDALTFTEQSGIVGEWNATTGVLTLRGTASIAEYQAALRSITFANASPHPSTGLRTITFVVNDGTEISLPATRDIGVMIGNEEPGDGGGEPSPIPTPPTPPIDPIIPGPPPPDVSPIPIPPTDGGAPPSVPPADAPENPGIVPPTTPSPVPAPEPLPSPVPSDFVPEVPKEQVPDGPGQPAAPAPSNSSPATARSVSIEREAPRVTGTVQIVPPLPQALNSFIDLFGSPQIRTRLTVALMQGGGALAAGYIALLLIHYSLARHTLILMPKFNLLDVHCLLQIQGRRFAIRS